MRSLWTWNLPHWAPKLGTDHLERSPWFKTFFVEVDGDQPHERGKGYQSWLIAKGLASVTCAWQRLSGGGEVPSGAKGAQGA